MEAEQGLTGSEKKRVEICEKQLDIFSIRAIIPMLRVTHTTTEQVGGIPEWPKGTDCKSAAYRFGGSNPPSPTKKSSTNVDDFFDFS